MKHLFSRPLHLSLAKVDQPNAPDGRKWKRVARLMAKRYHAEIAILRAKNETQTDVIRTMIQELADALSTKVTLQTIGGEDN